MDKREFYNHVAEWSISRRKLSYVIQSLTEVLYKIRRDENNGAVPSEIDLKQMQELKSEKARLQFIVDGIVDTLDCEVDRVEAMLAEQNKQSNQ